MRNVLYSFIVPFKEFNDYVIENVESIRMQTKQNWEIILLPNNQTNLSHINDERIVISSTGNKTPGEKRDQGARIARGDYLIFLDDDSFLDKNYLNILETLTNVENFDVLGGPGITPEHNTFWQKVSGAVFISKFTGGNPQRYFPVDDIDFVDDWPTVNLVVKKAIFEKVGGFENKFWPGEDTYFCFKLLEKGYKIRYKKNLIVFHHRRTNLRQHLLQIGQYGYHRGFFTRKYPLNSRKLRYFVPSIITSLLTTSFVLYLTNPTFKPFVMTIVVSYLVIIFIASIKLINRYSLKLYLATIPYIIFTHFYYGFRFIEGFFSRNIKSKLR
jgi:GT2 family glycosyltransferase